MAYPNTMAAALYHQIHIMQNKKDIRSYNNKGQHHGYWEEYINNTLWNKCFYINDIEYGYEIIFKDKLYHAK